jgi:hypothetical protein
MGKMEERKDGRIEESARGKSFTYLFDVPHSLLPMCVLAVSTVPHLT